MTTPDTKHRQMALMLSPARERLIGRDLLALCENAAVSIDSGTNELLLPSMGEVIHIRLPDFVTEEDFRWAVEEAEKKKGLNLSKAEFLTIEEGLCVQCMHIGPYDDEPGTVDAMHEFMEKEGYVLDITDKRLHHEIYLSDVRKVAPEKLKTVIRHPVRNK